MKSWLHYSLDCGSCDTALKSLKAYYPVYVDKSI